MLRPTICLLATLIPCARSALAQQDPLFDELGAATALETPSAAEMSSGALERVAGELWGGGLHYKVRFDPASFEFTPALGSRAPRDYTLRFTVLSVGRRDGTEVGASPPRLAVEKSTVRYLRPDFEEIYEVGRIGIEQSFRFDRLPPGSGDLVVRGRLETDLEPGSPTEDGIAFTLDGVGGMSIGAVTGVDASGAHVPGELHYTNGVLELSLPAEFVDAAQLPLLVDPTVGGVFTVEGTTNDRGDDPDVAYDSLNDAYLVVWEETFSAVTTSIRARLLNGSGIPIDNELLVTNQGGFIARNPSTGFVRQARRFLIAWEDNSSSEPGFDIAGRSYEAATGNFGPIAFLRVESGNERFPDVGGDSTLTDNDAVVVYDDITEDDIEAMEVSISSVTGVVNGFNAINIRDSVPNVGFPKIAKSGGASGNYMIVWERSFTGFSSNIEAGVFTRNLAPVVPLINIATSGDHENSPEVDGDGRNWVIAWAADAVSGGIDNDILCRSAELLGSSTRLGPEVDVEANASDDETQPSVAWCGGSALIAFSDARIDGGADMYVHSVDPYTCESCEGEWQIRIDPTFDDRTSAVVSAFNPADPTAQDALIVWQGFNAGDLTVYARRFETIDGVTTDLGGGCGFNATEAATCARLANSEFRHRLRGAPRNRPAVFLFGLDRRDIRCGPCRVVPDPFTSYAAVLSTDSVGNAEVTMPLPALPGYRAFTFYEQWIVVETGSSSCMPLSSNLSNALLLQIQ